MSLRREERGLSSTGREVWQKQSNTSLEFRVDALAKPLVIQLTKKGADRQRETDLNRIECPYNYKQNVRKKEDFGCENKRF